MTPHFIAPNSPTPTSTPSKHDDADFGLVDVVLPAHAHAHAHAHADAHADAHTSAALQPELKRIEGLAD